MKIAFIFAAAAVLSAAERHVIPLDGEWKIADSTAAEPAPAAYPGRVPVPGLANLAQPPFKDADRFDSREFIDTSIREKKMPESARVSTAGVPHQERNYFWYAREFTLPAARQSALLRVNKAMFGTAVWVNGKKAGEHLGCFTAGVFDITGLVKWNAPNEVVIRIGAHPAALPVWAPAGTDFEKYKWTPGIYDSVSIALADNPLIESIQVAPRIAGPEILIEAVISNTTAKPISAPVRFEVKGWKPAEQKVPLQAGERRTIRVTLPMPGAKLWTPEEPNLYTLQTSTAGDSQATRFGVREFRFDTPTKRAYLNGKLYFMRGSNITLHRFFEDPECKRLPWDEKWVRRLLVEVPKQMSWNSFRLCIGPVPEKWLEIADEAGLLLQYEFFIWNGRSGFPPYKSEELLTQYKEWMR